MKTIFILLGFCISPLICYGQKNDTITFKEYFNSKNNSNDYIYKLNNITDAKSEKNYFTIYGYNKDNDSTLLTRKILSNRYDVFTIYKSTHIFNSLHYSPVSITVMTVPVKVRPNMDEFKSNALSGLSNLGLNFDLINWKFERYFSFNKISQHRFHIGLWLAPSIEELDSINTRGFLDSGNKSKQIFISLALTFNYTYNNFTFTFVPIGYDKNTSSTGDKWIYNQKRWWGFGIGIKPSFLNILTNE